MPHVGPGSCRLAMIHFLAGCHKRCLNLALLLLCLAFLCVHLFLVQLSFTFFYVGSRLSLMWFKSDFCTSQVIGWEDCPKIANYVEQDVKLTVPKRKSTYCGAFDKPTVPTPPPRLQSDLLCVEWDVKPYSLTHYATTVYSLPSARQHPSCGDCLEVKREYYQNCSALDCVTVFTVSSTLL